MSTASVLNGLSGQARKDVETLMNLGSGVNTAQNEFNSTVQNTNDPGKIAAAKMKFEDAVQKLQAKVSIMETLNKMIDQIIARIGQIGQ